MIEEKILIELLESYIEEHEISIREILEVVNASASYLLKDITNELVKKTSTRFKETSEPEENEEEKEEYFEIPKPKLKIISNFCACDRLEELDEIPRDEDGEIDYWQASKLLCEKDGGRLPTMKELAEIASYMYQEEIGEFEENWDLKLKNELIPVGGYWSSSELSTSYAYRRYISGSYSTWLRYVRSYSGYRALCVGD